MSFVTHKWISSKNESYVKVEFKNSILLNIQKFQMVSLLYKKRTGFVYK